jgi:5'-methylthioadenosine phosphorylase
VEIGEVLRILEDATERARAIVAAVAGRLPATRPCSCGSALAQAIITDRSRIPAKARNRLRIIAGKYL